MQFDQLNKIFRGAPLISAFMRMPALSKFGILATVLGCVEYGLIYLLPQLAWVFPTIVTTLVLLRVFRIHLGLHFGVNISFQSAASERWSGQSKNSDAIAAQFLSASVEAYWALVVASVFRSIIIT